MERMMKAQEVIMKAAAGKLKWWEAAEIMGVTDRTMRRWRERMKEHGYSGLWASGGGAGIYWRAMRRTRLCVALLTLFAAAITQADDQVRPSWLGQEPLIVVGNWDSAPIFRRRAGGASLDMEEQYARQHTEEAVVKLKQLGVTLAIVHFY